MKTKLFEIFRAIHRARYAILSVALTYLFSVVLGMVMVHRGNQFAISQRDGIVAKAQSSPILVALDQNNRLQAALLDFGANLFAALGTTLSGLGVITSYPIIAYRGWIGGIVSIDGSHTSRLADPSEAAYYLITLVLQLIPYTLSGGAGVKMGLAFFKASSDDRVEKWLGIPKEALRDVFRIYLLVIPLFLIASVWEFLMR